MSVKIEGASGDIAESSGCYAERHEEERVIKRGRNSGGKEIARAPSATPT
jgi:hypothetical protein